MVLGLLGSAVMLVAAAVGLANQRWRRKAAGRGPYCKLCWDYDCPNPHNNLTKHQEGET